MTIAEANVQKLDAERCELGEGPHYDRIADAVWWLDIVGRKLLEHDFQTGKTTIHALPVMASAIASVDDRRQLLAMEDGFYVRERDSGQLECITELEANDSNTRSNDGRVHPSGRMWLGTMGKKAQKGAGAIYWFDGAEVKRLFPRISIPNSICFSPDGRTGYFADTAVNTVWRVQLDPVTGLPIGEPDVFLTGKDLPLGGSFDGSVTDADGVLWNASWGGGSVTGFAPDGSPLKTFEAPAAQVSCPCFVGRDLDRLLVTSAWQGYSYDQRATDPGAGFTYVIDGDFKGQADIPFRLPEKDKTSD